MKSLVAALVFLLTVSFTAQETITYPYNPDSDNDAFVASTDLLELLGLYGNEFSPAEIMIGDTGLVQWIQLLSQTLQSQQELINQLQSDSIALPDGIFSGDILIWNGTAWIPESSTVFIITDDNIHSAVAMWLFNEDVAEATYGHISDWDVSSVTNMDSMFEGASSFNGDISSWDVSSVTIMSGMFQSASSFNGDLSNWDVSSVTNMYNMFNESSFNGDISSWDVSSVTNMAWMFQTASSFNGDISSWDVSSVTNMEGMFVYAESFNRDLSSWDVSSVTNMNWMFESVSALSVENKCLIHTSFSSNANWQYDYWSCYCGTALTPINNDNIHEAVDMWLSLEVQGVCVYGQISEWDVSSVTDMSSLFSSAEYFNSDISSWDVSSVTNMEGMFVYAYSFNGDLSTWDVSSVTNMEAMFFFANSFNGDLSAWDVSSVTNMSEMFSYTDSFNGDLSAWDVSSVTNMFEMFDLAPSFNRDLSAWNVSSVTNMDGIFSDTALSEENKCAINTSFSEQNENWPYDWSGFCPACGDLVAHEGYDYSTVQIGDQCWFAENCRYLPEVSPYSDGSGTDPYYYVYGYEGSDVGAAQATSNYATYGVLYNWPAVMTEGICPSGWHIPSDGEWQTMEISLGMSESDASSTGWRGSPVGNYLKSTSGWNDSGNGSNSSGFNGLPGGYRYSADFTYVGGYGYWWSASESSTGSWDRDLNYTYDNVGRSSFDHDHGLSARCVRD